MILKGMVAVFVLCQCFTIGADAYELICTIGGSMTGQTMCTANIHIENVINFSHFMLAVNSSVNFIFYMMNIEGFRKEFMNVSTYRDYYRHKIRLQPMIIECIFCSSSTTYKYFSDIRAIHDRM